MNRQQAKELLPIIQAFAEGKTIQVKGPDNRWYDYSGNRKLKFDSDPQKYRIKPEPKYRPFVNNKECWNEMLRHQPFGWVRNKNVEYNYYIIDGVYYSENYEEGVAFIAGKAFNYKEMIDNYLFADGTPFGIKE